MQEMIEIKSKAISAIQDVLLNMDKQLVEARARAKTELVLPPLEVQSKVIKIENALTNIRRDVSKALGEEDGAPARV